MYCFVPQVISSVPWTFHSCTSTDFTAVAAPGNLSVTGHVNVFKLLLNSSLGSWFKKNNWSYSSFYWHKPVKLQRTCGNAFEGIRFRCTEVCASEVNVIV